MSIEIKFRAYGKITCYYLTKDEWKPEIKMCEVSSLNIKTNKCRVLYKGEHNTNEYDIFDLSEVNLMQFTGLKDKNGKEIYEGDIVSYFQPYANRTDIHFVKWDNLFAGFGLFEKNNEWCKESDWLKIQEIVIIGNIHENPELL